MRLLDRNTLRSIPIWRSAALFTAALALLFFSTAIDITIIVESPAIGNISTIMITATQATATIITLLSGGITMYNVLADSDENPASGPTDSFVVEGDLHLHLGDPTFTQSKDDKESPQNGDENAEQKPIREDPETETES